MRMTMLAIAAFIGTAAAAAGANAQVPAGEPAAACPAGSGWVGPQYGKWDNWEPGHCVRYSTTAANVAPAAPVVPAAPAAAAAGPAGSGWMEAHYDNWNNWVQGACVAYTHP